jgi:hypothetical protein
MENEEKAKREEFGLDGREMAGGNELLLVATGQMGTKTKKWGKLRKKFRRRRRTADWRQEKTGKIGRKKEGETAMEKVGMENGAAEEKSLNVADGLKWNIPPIYGRRRTALLGKDSSVRHSPLDFPKFPFMPHLPQIC